METDPRLEADAYVRHDERMYRVVGPEIDDRGCITGRYELESAKGEWSAYGHGRGTWVYPRCYLTAIRVTWECQLVRASNGISHLDEAMRAHLHDNGLHMPATIQAGMQAPLAIERTLRRQVR